MNKIKLSTEPDDEYGVNVKEWARIRNTYILERKITVDDYSRLNQFQKSVINEVKKTFKSI